jgi:hypothetical protein
LAWSVIRTTPGNTDYPESTVPFDKVLVNSGDVWNTSLNAAVIPISGFYYVYTAINTYYTGRGMFNVKVNEIKQFDVKFFSTTYKAEQTRGNGAILRLKTGDKVTVEQPSLEGGVISLGHYAGRTSFYGMLVLPE